jgi:RNA polymerase sigma-70 factor (ECF subfamily)
MVPTSANGQPAAVAWCRGEPFGLAVLTTAPDGIAGITLFADPALTSRFAPT